MCWLPPAFPGDTLTNNSKHTEMKEKEYHLNITDRTEDDGQRSVFINVSVPGDDSQAAVETLLRAASDLVFGCGTEPHVPDMEEPSASAPGGTHCIVVPLNQNSHAENAKQ